MSSLRATWAAGPTGSPTGYELKIVPLGASVGEVIALAGHLSTTYTKAGALPATTYTCEVLAVDATSSSQYSNMLNATTFPAPPSPPAAPPASPYVTPS
eukprot:1746574-Prymnesium_polylepis.1